MAVAGVPAARREAGYYVWLSQRGLAPLLAYLRAAGVVPGPEPCPAPGPADVLLGRYRRYLEAERGLSASTVRMYGPRRGVPGRAGGVRLAGLSAAEVSGFVAAGCRKRSTGPAKITGHGAAVAAAVPRGGGPGAAGPAGRGADGGGRRDGGLPRALPDGQVAALLASCDREHADRAAGLRGADAAVAARAAGLRGRGPGAGRHRLAGRDDDGPRQGPARRAAPAAVGRRRGAGRLAARRPPARLRGPPGVPDRRGRRAGHVGHGGRERGRPARLRAGGAARGRRAPAAALGRDRDARGRRGRWPRSARCCGTGRPPPPRSTPRPTTAHWRQLAMPWPGGAS